MHILVTGAGGFIGSHLVEALLAAGHHVRAQVRYSSRGDWGNLQHLRPAPPERLSVQHGDVTDGPQLVRRVEGCEAVLHLAALIGIPYSYEAPASYVAVNVHGGLHVLDACRVAGVRRVVMTSTSEVYGTARAERMTEDHPLSAQSPYAASKIAADKLAEAYACSFGLPVVVLRPFNTYGPRQSPRAVIPAVLQQAIAGADPIRVGSLDPRRDMTFVDDTVRAFMLALSAEGVEGETIHVGSGEARSIGALVEACLRAAGSRARVEVEPCRQRPARSEVGALCCDASKARRLLGWAPRVDLDEGLRRTVEHLRATASASAHGEYRV